MNIIVNIEAGEKECGECLRSSDALDAVYCKVFEKELIFSKKAHRLRCPACLEAEAKLKALVEACDSLGDAPGWPEIEGDRGDWWGWYGKMRQALAAVKGEKDA